MSGVGIPILLVAATLAPAARAEFRLFVLEGTAELAVPPLYQFGAVAPGDVATARFRLRNESSEAAVLSYLEVRGVGFGPRNPLALPMTIGAQGVAEFSVTFSATGIAAYSAALDSEGVSVLLTATVVPDLPLPAPHLALDLPHPQSGQQGSVTVRFDQPAARGGSGALSLDFLPGVAGAADPAIVFASGARITPFTFVRGDTQCQTVAWFQTGTTAGVLTVTAEVGGVSDRVALTIAPAPVGIRDAQGLRNAASVEVRIAGFDNTRTAGPLVFTFFDAGGIPLAPGVIRADAAAAFRQYFQDSGAGGAFLLRAVFPVTGDPSRIAAFEAGVGNAEGAAVSSRTPF